MSDLIKRDDALNACSIVDWNAEAFELVDNALRALPATDRIEELETRNKDLALQLLAAHGQAADALDKLATAVALALMECPYEYDTKSYDNWWDDRRAVLAALEK